jgi:outer membrane protein OmpA-like peptidoglycan-associated protein
MSAHSDYNALKDVLFGHEKALLDELRRIVADHDLRVGSTGRLSESVATVLADSLKSASVRNRKGLALAIAPVIIDGIRGEIRNSRNEIVDALYPIMGRLTSAYVLSVFRDFVEETNHRLESRLSGRLLRLRLKSFFTGTPYAELLLREGGAFRIQDIMLIDAEKGVLLERWSAPDAMGNESPAEDSGSQFTAMLAAINRFSTETLKAKRQELRIIDAGASQLYLRTAVKCLFAVRATGSGGRKLLKSIDGAILEILEIYEPSIQSANQEEATRARRQALLGLADKLQQSVAQTRGAPIFAIALFGLIGALLAGWIGWMQWEKVQTARIYRAAASVVQNHPGVAGFPVSVGLDPRRSKFTLSGFVSSYGIKEELEHGIRAKVPEIPLESTLLVMPDAHKVDELQRTAAQVLARLNDLAERRGLQEADAKILGLAKELAAVSSGLDEQRANIASLRQEALSPERRLAEWVGQNAIFFAEDTQFREPDTVRKQLLELRDLLAGTALHLRLVGFTDALGDAENNDRLASNRAKAVADELVKLGIPASRLTLAGRAKEGLIAVDRGPASRNRRVEFHLAFINE